MYWLSWKEHCSSVSVGFSWLMQAFAMFLVAMLSVCSRSKHTGFGLRISGAVILFFVLCFCKNGVLSWESWEDYFNTSAVVWRRFL